MIFSCLTVRSLFRRCLVVRDILRCFGAYAGKVLFSVGDSEVRMIEKPVRDLLSKMVNSTLEHCFLLFLMQYSVR